MTTKLLNALFISLLTPGLFYGQEIVLKSSKAKAAVRDYQRKIKTEQRNKTRQLEKIEDAYTKESKALRAGLLAKLTEQMEAEARIGDLEKATKIKALLDQMKEAKLPTLQDMADAPPDEAAPPKSTPSQPADSKARSKPAQIPSNAVTFQGHQYALMAEKLPWHLAHKQAASLGGYLVRIETPEEYQFLRENLIGDVKKIWLDGSDEIQEGRWIFANGEPVNFAAFQLDSCVKDRTCGRSLSNRPGCHTIFFYHDGILDEPGTSRFQYIVEWEE